MTLTPVRRMAAAVVMTLIAVATVVSLTRSEAPATDAALASDSADLPGIAAVAPDVDATLNPSPADLLEQSTSDLIDEAIEQSSPDRAGATTTPVTEKATTPAPSTPTTSAPTTSAPTTPAPKPAPAPSPSPTPKKGVVGQLLDLLNGSNG